MTKCATEGCGSAKILARGLCKKCYAREWSRAKSEDAEHRAAKNRKRREWLKTEAGKTWRERQVKRAKIRYPETGARRRAGNRKSMTGFSPELYATTLVLQDNRCAICHAPFDATLKACADHCHATGSPRGILCDKCNRGLGYFGDCIEGLLDAVEYLRNPPAALAALVAGD